MRTLSKTVQCPICAQPASLVLFDDPRVRESRPDGPAAQRFEFRCSNRSHRLDETAGSLLWAA